MSETTHTTISLPPARALQLRAIAHANDCNVTEAVELLINREIKEGRLPDILPGFAVHTGHGHICLEIGSIGLPRLHPAHARTVADLFDHAADRQEDGKGKVITLNEGDEHLLTIARKGRGIVGKVECDEWEVDERFSMTPGMARDFARQIRKAADRIQKR